MKWRGVLLIIVLMSCNNQQQKNAAEATDTSLNKDTATTNTGKFSQPGRDTLQPAKVYANKRFRNVTVEKTGDHQFRVRGQGQIFEASFGWVVEDGHDELKQGYSTTDAGAPAWGNFDFLVQVEKKEPGTTLHLILFETSAKDGSRQYELPVLLY